MTLPHIDIQALTSIYTLHGIIYTLASLDIVESMTDIERETITAIIKEGLKTLRAYTGTNADIHNQISEIETTIADLQRFDRSIV